MSQPFLILLVIAGYFILWLVVSWWSARGADNATFFIGNRKMPWPLVAIAMIGAPITGVTFISVPGMVITKGFSYLQMGLGFIVGYLVIALVLIPLYYRLKIVSIYGFLERRFGAASRKTGAWLFFFSKILGISIRFLVVCAMLQFLVFDPLGIPYVCCVIVSLLLIWLSTFKGGVKSVIWSDILKSTSLFATVILCIYFISSHLGLSVYDISSQLTDNSSSRVFFFDDPLDPKYFWKQFLAGIFIVIAMTGLDQDMMQRSLACRSSGESRKNLVVSSVMQFVICSLFLVLGFVMMLYLAERGEVLPEKSDHLFATVAFHQEIPMIVGILFILGLVAATYSSVGSALTAMTTTMTFDILGAGGEDSAALSLKKKRKIVHLSLSVLMVVLVLFFYYLNEDDAISTVYTVISYTDGPILGLFLFGLISKREVNERWLPVICLSSPFVAWTIKLAVEHGFGYETSFELLLLNAGLTYLGLLAISRKVSQTDVFRSELTAPNQTL